MQVNHAAADLLLRFKKLSF